MTCASMWVWPSMNPGATISPSASITRRAESLMRPMATMRPAEIPTSPANRFAPEPSTTVPLLIRRSSIRGLSRVDQNNESENDQRPSSKFRRHAPGGEQLLDEYESGDDGYPEKVHDTDGEEQEHQHPATADAVGPVLQAHAQGARRAG